MIQTQGNNTVITVNANKLKPFKDHPYQVNANEDMDRLVESIKEKGVLTPLIIRPLENTDEFEVISGHRRLYAAQKAGITELPAFVHNISRDEAVVEMVDSNIQRENILPSERAFAYRMKMEAIKHQGSRADLTSSQFETKLRSDQIVADEAGQSRATVQRYIRLTELIPELLDMVDNGQLKFNPAVELSYLAREEQQDFLSAMDYAQTTPSLSQAQRIKKLAQEGECTLDAMCDIMNEIKKEEQGKVTFKTDALRRYFPKSYTNKQMEDKIIQLLEQWQKKREKSMER